MRYEDMTRFMNKIIEDVMRMREAGQKEYAHGDNDNVFNNFERVASLTGMTREQVLYVYFLKHSDGISAYLKGHISQREPVSDRIIDAIVYLMLLYGMIAENDQNKNEKSMIRQADPAQRPTNPKIPAMTIEQYEGQEPPKKGMDYQVGTYDRT